MKKEIGTAIPRVDSWIPEPQDVIFTNAKGIIIAPIAQSVGLVDPQYNSLNYFIMSPKKCYNSQVMRDHTCMYLNYFEKYYDPEKELLLLMSRIKCVMDTTPTYNEEDFRIDIRRYIISDRIKNAVIKLVDDNYMLDLQYKNITENLMYTNDHAKIMLCMSLFMNFVIPLLSHFAHLNKVGIIDEFIMQIFNDILYMFPGVDIYAKLYETTNSNVLKSEAKNPIWMKQDIRGKDTVTHSYASVGNIILNIMPKYTFDKSIISLNFTSINKNTSCQVLDIEYEYNYIALSSSRRDEDNVSDFDKYESSLCKQDESLFIQSKMNCEDTMNRINAIYGPYDQWEIEFYKNRLKTDSGYITNNFQRTLIFNMFMKNFRDTNSIYTINNDDYVKLMLAARKILLDNRMICLPFIISGKVEKIVGRKSVNKKELIKMQSSSCYSMVMNKYRNDKVIKQILSAIATIISSDFSIIDYFNRNIDGKRIETSPDIIIEEYLTYVLLV